MVNAPSPSPVLLPKWPPSLSVYGQLGVRGVWGPITDCEEKVLIPQFGVFCQPQQELEGSAKRSADFVKQQPGRARQTS